MVDRETDILKTPQGQVLGLMKALPGYTSSVVEVDKDGTAERFYTVGNQERLVLSSAHDALTRPGLPVKKKK